MARGTIENFKVLPDGTVESIEQDNPPRGFAHVDEIAPKGLPIGSIIFIVEKLTTVWSDGRNNWYAQPDKPFAAGQPWSNMFQ